MTVRSGRWAQCGSWSRGHLARRVWAVLRGHGVGMSTPGWLRKIGSRAEVPLSVVALSRGALEFQLAKVLRAPGPRGFSDG